MVESQPPATSSEHEEKGHEGASERKRPKFMDSIRNYQDRLNGWQTAILSFAVLTSVVFLINLIVTIWISASNGASTSLQGDCDKIKRWNTGLHVVINALGTVLLSGSNYCMQIMNAPTRSEIDRAHAKGNWLDIGMPSMRNIRHIGKRRTILWALFAVSSLPLHLFYNSAVTGTLSSNDYEGFLVSEAFLTGPTPWYRDCFNCLNNPYSPARSFDAAQDLENLRQQALKAPWDRLENAECIKQYATDVQYTRRNLFVVLDNRDSAIPEYFLNNETSLRGTFGVYAPTVGDRELVYRWICNLRWKPDSACRKIIAQATSDPENWRIGNIRVRYCVSEPAGQHCRLYFDRTIMIIVTALNFMKACLMYYILLYNVESPILTLGDAVSTFIETPDPLTMHKCLASARDFRRKGGSSGAQTFINGRRRCKDVISKKRRVVMLLIFLGAMILGGMILKIIIDSMPQDSLRTFSELWDLGFGTIDPRTLMRRTNPTTIIGTALLANSFQVLLSVIYFCYNSLCTAMFMGHEWSSYAKHRKGLRVSQRPMGKQRSTYFLQLPYRFGIPLMCASGALHWLLSQSIFVVHIDFYDNKGREAGRGEQCGNSDYKQRCIRSIVTCGYSPIALITVIFLAALMVFALLAVGFIPYKSSMSIVGSNSLAISAACHANETELQSCEVPLSHKDLQWGVVSTGDGNIGHCTFSAEEVGAPQKGHLYAGIM